MELDSVLLRGMLAIPVGWQLWLGWMALLNLVVAAFYSVKHPEARFILVAFLASAVVMVVIADNLGYVRLLGIGHVVLWTPLMICLFKRVAEVGVDRIYAKYLMAVLVTNSLSLVIDYVDVGRYILGERLPYVAI
jgi:hypothetical protein